VLHLGVRGAVATTFAMVFAGCASAEPTATPSVSAPAGSARPSAVVYRTPTCGCCKSYEEYLREQGFGVRSEVRDDLTSVRADNGVPPEAASCHTVIIDGYAVEGHVPVEAIDKLLAERPSIDGIAIPGMPTNAPGMGEPDGNPIEVVSFTGGHVGPFVTF